jgi:cytosine/adenosine deaminase-related metal-dependent hydrolase
LRIVGASIAAVGANPQPGDSIVDLQGDRILPGLINAHDHLQFNNMPDGDRLERYDHARDWIAAVAARLRSDPVFEASVALERDDRLFLGGVKNLLSGVTTVAHHDPLYPCLARPDFPTKVVQSYGWSHSLYVDGEDRVKNSYRNNPVAWPWIVHAAEGLDHEAWREFERLEEIGCIGSNTLLVHGIALDPAQRQRLARASAGLIWCPSSNLRLFGRTAEVADLMRLGRVALGTDSRLTGARDLLDELRVAAGLGGLDDRVLEALVTRDSAQLLRLGDRGVLRVGASADILVLPARTSLAAACRADVRLVLIDGRVRYGERDLADRAGPGPSWHEVQVDGRAKIMDSRIVARLSRAGAGEAGVELPKLAGRAA